MQGTDGVPSAASIRPDTTTVDFSGLTRIGFNATETPRQDTARGKKGNP
jgi:hypothetical protein